MGLHKLCVNEMTGYGRLMSYKSLSEILMMNKFFYQFVTNLKTSQALIFTCHSLDIFCKISGYMVLFFKAKTFPLFSWESV